jgi:hypothetical protein
LCQRESRDEADEQTEEKPLHGGSPILSCRCTHCLTCVGALC